MTSPVVAQAQRALKQVRALPCALATRSADRGPALLCPVLVSETHSARSSCRRCFWGRLRAAHQAWRPDACLSTTHPRPTWKLMHIATQLDAHAGMADAGGGPPGALVGGRAGPSGPPLPGQHQGPRRAPGAPCFLSHEPQATSMSSFYRDTPLSEFPKFNQFPALKASDHLERHTVLQGRQDSLALIPGSWASVTAEQFFLYLSPGCSPGPGTASPPAWVPKRQPATPLRFMPPAQAQDQPAETDSSASAAKADRHDAPMHG